MKDPTFSFRGSKFVCGISDLCFKTSWDWGLQVVSFLRGCQCKEGEQNPRGGLRIKTNMLRKTQLHSTKDTCLHGNMSQSNPQCTRWHVDAYFKTVSA